MKKRSVTLVLSALFLALIISPALIRAEGESTEVPEARTVTGHIVDLNHYLATGTLHSMPEGEKSLLDAFAPEAPIALVVDDKSLADKLLPGHKSYVIVFDSSDKAVRGVYTDARKLLGQAVAVTGRVYERDGLHAISIIGVHTIPEDHAAAADPRDDQM